MKTFWMGLTALGLQCLADGAGAQQSYLTAGLGNATWAFDCGPSGCQRSVSAWRVGAGYRFNRVVAIEGFYADFGRGRSSDFVLDGSLGASAAGVQALVGWQFGDFELGGKIGLSRLRSVFNAASTSSYASSKVTRSEVIGGLMGAYHLSPQLSIRLDADIVTAALDGDAVYYSRGSDVVSYVLGLAWRF
jgi:hypothetical protein